MTQPLHADSLRAVAPDSPAPARTMPAAPVRAAAIRV